MVHSGGVSSKKEGNGMNKMSAMGIFLCSMLMVVGGSVYASQGLTAMTFNIYAFDSTVTSFVGAFTKRDLAERTSIPLAERVDKVAAFIKQLQIKPDLIFIQEAWLDDNKQQLINQLKGEYPQAFYTPTDSAGAQLVKQVAAPTTSLWDLASSLAGAIMKVESGNTASLSPVTVDSGLLILAKDSIKVSARHDVEFTQKEGDDAPSRKGAIGIRFEKNGIFYFGVNTHPQSGGAHFATVYPSQMQQIADMIGQYAVVNDRVFMMGDLNQSITYRRDIKAIVDNTVVIPNVFNSTPSIRAKQFWFSNPVITLLIDIFAKQRTVISSDIIVQYFPVEKVMHEDFTNAARSSVYTVPNPVTTKAEDPLKREGPIYFEQATSFEGNSILDHCICTQNMQLKDVRFFRKEILGDKGPQKPSDSATAISDHAPVLFIFQ